MPRRFKKPKPLSTRPPSIVPPRFGACSVFKYFSERRYAEAFLEGHVLFRSLAYFRDNEDAVRGDEYEGTSKFSPDRGLEVQNHTQGTTFKLPMAFQSTVNCKEIVAFCVSQVLSDEVAAAFNASWCVEITKVHSFCSRIKSALPPSAVFRARPVDYYPETEAGNPRWAIPDQIATSKLARWAQQREYRFLFSVTDALKFQNVRLQLIDRKSRPSINADEHIEFPLSVGPLLDICILHDCAALPPNS